MSAEVASRLKDIEPGSTVALEISVEQYFDVVRGVLDNFANTEGHHSIYIASSVSAATVLEALNALQVDTENIRFVDCLSYMLMAEIKQSDQIVYLESPTMLENIILKVEYLMRGGEEGHAVILLDSIDSLAIHNTNKILTQFLQIFLGGLRERGAYPMVLSITEQSTPEIKEMISLLCDHVISFGEESTAESP